MWLDTVTFIATKYYYNTHSVNGIPQRCLIDLRRLLLVDSVSIEICYYFWSKSSTQFVVFSVPATSSPTFSGIVWDKTLQWSHRIRDSNLFVIVVMDTFIFSSSKISKDGGSEAEIRRQWALGRETMNNLAGIIKNHDISLNTKARYYFLSFYMKPRVGHWLIEDQ